MKNKRNLAGIALLFTCLLFSACQKDKAEKDLENPAPAQVSRACNLTRIIEGGGSDSTITDYVYDAGNKVVRINTLGRNRQLFSFRTYTYNAQGKAQEEIYHRADGTVKGKQVFTYNSLNQLTQITFQGESTDEYFPADLAKIALHYNNQGQRTKADFYRLAQPNAIHHYYTYTYNQGMVQANHYDATTTPATLAETLEFHFDNKQSAFHALGYLSGYVPDREKHNLKLLKKTAVGFGTQQTSFNYEYDSSGYPVKATTISPLGWEPSSLHYVFTCP